MLALSWLFVLASTLVFQGVLSAPASSKASSNKDKEPSAGAVPAAPHFVLYSDEWVSGETGPPSPSTIQGFNVLILAFLLSSGPADQALEWTLISASDRANYLSEYSAAGIDIMVTAYGSTEEPTTSGLDPVQQANFMGDWVQQYGLAGLDVDYEDFTSINDPNNGGAAEAWLASFTRQIRTILPQGQFIITHAPVAPWFSAGWTGGGYLTVDQQVGSLIDWYNIQFYNQGTEYTTCTGLISSSGGQYPGSSLFEIAANGVPLSRLVIGKPGTTGDAPQGGYIDPGTLAGCLVTAKNGGWNTGVSAWQFPDAAAAWISTVRSQAFPE